MAMQLARSGGDSAPDLAQDLRLRPGSPPFRAAVSDGSRTREIAEELIFIGHSPGAKHWANLFWGGGRAYTRAPLPLPLLVKRFKLWPAIFFKFIPKGIETLLIETPTPMALELFTNLKVFSQAGREWIFANARWCSEASCKYAFGLGKHLLIDGDVDDLERRQAGKEVVMVLEVGFKTRRFCSCPVHIAQRNHRLRIGCCARHEYGKSVREVPDAHLPVRVRRPIFASEQAISLESKRTAEKIKFFVFRCQVLVLRMGENEIQAHQLCFDGEGLTPALVRVVIVGKGLVHGVGAEVVDQRPICRGVDPDMTLCNASLDETFGARPRLLAQKSVILATQKIAAMKGDRAEKRRLAAGVAAALQGADPLFICHSDRMASIRPGPSGTGARPRVRRALSRAAEGPSAYSLKPTLAFSSA